MSKRLPAVCLAATLMVLGACGTSDETDAPASATNGGDSDQVELRFTWWGGQERHDRTLQVIKRYEELNPHVKIVPEYSGMDGYFDKLSTQFAAGNAPDIVQYGGNLNDFVGRGVVLPLNEYVGSDIILDEHDETMIEAATFDDEFYGVTLGTNALGVLINKTMFEEANMALPSDDWTWDELAEITEQITNSIDGAYGVADFGEDGFGNFLTQQQKFTYLDEEYGFEEQDVVDWFTLWEDMRESGAAVPAEIQVAASETPEQSLIVQRDVAMELVTSNQYSAYSNSSEDEFVLHIYPYGDKEDHGVALRPSQFLAGSNNTEHPEEVAKFLNYFVNDEEAAHILGNDRGAPVNAELRTQLIESGDEVDELVFTYIDWVSETSQAPYIPNLPGYNENTKLFLESSERVAFGQASPEEAATMYYQELQSNIERYSE